jgi:hypothetical protein
MNLSLRQDIIRWNLLASPGNSRARYISYSNALAIVMGKDADIQIDFAAKIL